jgi:hypothetical protein
VADTGTLYAALTVPLGKDVVVMVNAGAMVNDNCLEAL